ncbi:MAG: class I SAM-dependent methyltransferase [Planctomycetaceae bacterium]|nr:class I SAM-dependent methyltransferase [Planctomycetaceae bacterium]
MYGLLDFGAGRKLERLGGFLLDRPSPSAEGTAIQKPELWQSVDAKFVPDRQGEQRGHWTFFNPTLSLETVWPISFPGITPPLTLELKCSPFGHLGVFPEQQTNWTRMVDLLSSAEIAPNVLNLFAYTGGSTLAAAAAGARVVHIDSAKNLLARAKRNAELSGLTNAPIRWIAEDAVRFVNRELKRNQKYDAIILDPPSYGHGTSGNVWKIDRDLPVLLQNCFELLSEKPRFLLLTCHTPFFDETKLAELVRRKGFVVQTFSMEIPASTGRKLATGCGVIAFPKDALKFSCKSGYSPPVFSVE